MVACPGGVATGHTYFIPSEEHLESGITTRGFMEARMVVSLAGRRSPLPRSRTLPCPPLSRQLAVPIAEWSRCCRLRVGGAPGRLLPDCDALKSSHCGCPKPYFAIADPCAALILRCSGTMSRDMFQRIVSPLGLLGAGSRV